MSLLYYEESVRFWVVVELTNIHILNTAIVGAPRSRNPVITSSTKKLISRSSYGQSTFREIPTDGRWQIHMLIQLILQIVPL